MTEVGFNAEQEEQLVFWFARGDDITAVRERIRFQNLAHRDLAPWPDCTRAQLDGYRRRTQSEVSRVMMARTNQAVLRGLAQRTVQVARAADDLQGIDMLVEHLQREVMDLIARGALQVEPSALGVEGEFEKTDPGVIEIPTVYPDKYEKWRSAGLSPRALYVLDMMFDRAMKILDRLTAAYGSRAKAFEHLARLSGTLDNDTPVEQDLRLKKAQELIGIIRDRRASATGTMFPELDIPGEAQERDSA